MKLHDNHEQMKVKVFFHSYFIPGISFMYRLKSVEMFLRAMPLEIIIAA